MTIKQLISATIIVYGSTHDPTAHAAEPISAQRYIAGGVIGSVVGYGIGHAITGDYGKIGWVFTLGESAGTGAMIAGVIVGFRSVNSSNVRYSSSINDASLGLGLMAGGAILAVSFHIWEVIDIWTRPKVFFTRTTASSQEKTPPLNNLLKTLSIAPVVSDHYTGIGLTFVR